MAYPNEAVKINSFTDDTIADPTSPHSGSDLDIEYTEHRRAISEIVAYLEGSNLNETGDFKDLTVNLNHLDTDVIEAIWGDDAPDFSAYLVTVGDAVSDAQAAQTAAEAAQTAAEAAQAAAEAAQTAAEDAYDDIVALPDDIVPQYTDTSGPTTESISALTQRILIADPLAWYRRADSEPAHEFKFRTVDRFLPDGSTDAANGGWWELDQDFMTSEIAGMIADVPGDDDAANATINATAISNARGFLSDKGGGKFIIGPGTFYIGSTITLDQSGVEIVGSGVDETILNFTEVAATNGFTLSGAYSEIQIRDLTTTAADLHGISVTASGASKPSAVTISNVAADANGSDGIHIEECSGLVMYSIGAGGNTGDGISVTGYASQVSIEDANAANNGAEGFLISDILGLTLDRCVADSNTLNGFNIEKVVGAEARSCDAQGNTLSGFKITGNTGGTVDGVRLNMIGCTADDNDSGGAGGNFIEANSSSGDVVLGLKFCRDTTASGGQSNEDTGSQTETFVEGCSFAATDDFENAGDSFGNQLLHVREEQTSGTEGGASSATTWNVRTINTTAHNEINGASVGSNQITLPTGTYITEGSAPHNGASSGHKLGLYNTTDAAFALIGENAESTDGVQTTAILRGKFTIAAQKVFELQHYTAAARATDGLGSAVSSGQVEVYADLKIWKVA